MRDSFVAGVLRTLSFPVALAIVLAAACTQTAPPPPIQGAHAVIQAAT